MITFKLEKWELKFAEKFVPETNEKQLCCFTSFLWEDYLIPEVIIGTDTHSTHYYISSSFMFMVSHLFISFLVCFWSRASWYLLGHCLNSESLLVSSQISIYFGPAFWAKVSIHLRHIYPKSTSIYEEFQ